MFSDNKHFIYEEVKVILKTSLVRRQGPCMSLVVFGCASCWVCDHGGVRMPGLLSQPWFPWVRDHVVVSQLRPFRGVLS